MYKYIYKIRNIKLSNNIQYKSATFLFLIDFPWISLKGGMLMQKKRFV
jgi:hypothetical protein